MKNGNIKKITKREYEELLQNHELSEGYLINFISNPVRFQKEYLKQEPHPKQCEVLLSLQKNKIIVCGRRSGKSQMIAGELIRGGVLELYPTQILIAPTYKQAIIVYDKIIELMNKAGVADDIEKSTANPPKIVFKNKAFINFASADNPDSLRGFAYDRMFKDESAFIKKGADNAIKPLIYDKGAPVWETTTPWGKGDIWEKWLRGQKGEDKDIACFHYNYKDNPYLSSDGVKEIEKDIAEYGEDSIYVQCEIYGNFVEDRDAYFTRELIESCIEDYEIPVLVNKRYTYYLGVDFARMGQDDSVFIPILNFGSMIKVNDLIETKQKLLTDSIGRIINMDIEYNFVKMLTDETGLGSGPTDVLVEKFGYKVEGVHFSVRLKMDMYSNLKTLMSQGKIKFPNHKKLIYQLMDLKYEVMSNGDLKIHHSERGHDDYPDALVLACWACKDEEIYKPMLG